LNGFAKVGSNPLEILKRNVPGYGVINQQNTESARSPRHEISHSAVLPALLPLPSPGHAQTRRAQPVEVDRIIAVVNDEAITAFELRARLATVERQLRDQKVQLPPRDVLEKQLLERMITDRVQLQFAKETGLRVSDIELDAAMRRIAEGNKLSLQDSARRWKRTASPGPSSARRFARKSSCRACASAKCKAASWFRWRDRQLPGESGSGAKPPMSKCRPRTS
jgi:hypothetical protein